MKEPEIFERYRKARDKLRGAIRVLARTPEEQEVELERLSDEATAAGAAYLDALSRTIRGE